MKFSILTFLILSLLAFSSCKKGDIKKDSIDNNEIKDDDLASGDDDKANCFDLVYPFTYTMPDGSIISGNEEELKLALKAWYEDHPDSNAKAILQYPVDIIIGDLIKTIEDEEAMIEVKEDCDEVTDEVSECDWDESEVAASDVWVKHIVEPIVVKDDCGCPVDGVVEYVKAGSDFATYVVYYGKGECDEWAFLVTYYDSDESDKKAEKCKFKLDCDPGN